MKCTVPGSNAKIMGRTLQTLSRIGDVLYIEPTVSGLSFKTVNSVKSAYAAINFLPNFFTDFKFDDVTEEMRESLKCKIAIKSCTSLFKISNMSKQVESLQIKFDTGNSKIIFFIKCRNDVVKTHYLPILDSDSLQAFYTKENVPNLLIFRTNVLLEAINNFQSNEEDVTFEADEEHVFVRNYENSSVKSKIIKTELRMISNEFEEYQINNNTSISFSMKELRAVLNFAEFLDLPVKFSFEAAGKPVVFIISNDSTFEANFVMATSEADCDEDISIPVPRVNSTISSTKQKSSIIEEETEIRRDDKNTLPSTNEVMFNFVEDRTSDILPERNSSINFSEQHLSVFNEDSSTKAKENHNISNKLIQNCDEIPKSPQNDKYDRMVKKVFKRCFQATYNPVALRKSQILAEDSDNE